MNLRFIIITLMILLSFTDLDLAYGSTSSSKIEIRQKVQQANKFYQENRYQEVIELIDNHIEDLDRNDLFMLAKSYAEVGNTILAIRTAQLIIGKNSKDLQAKTLIAVQYHKQKKEKESINLLKEVLVDNSKYLPAYEALINIYTQRKDTSPAARKTTRYELRLVYQDMVDKIGESSKYIAKLCQLSTLDGLYEIAEKYCSRGIEIDPQNPENHTYLGISHLMTGREKSGETILKNAALKFVTSSVAQEKYAARLMEQKNYIDAFKYYLKASELSPDQADIWIGLGNSAMEIQKYDIALSSYIKNCEISKKIDSSFRVAIATLRSNKANEWISKFTSGIDSCSLKKN